MLSLFMAFVVSSLLYQDRIHNLIEENLIANGKKIIQTYQSTPSADLIPFIQNFSGFSSTLLQLYNKDGKPLLNEKQVPIHVERSNVERVLAGGIARNIDTGEYHLPMIGLPFQVKGEPYALFLTLEKNSIDEEFMNSIQHKIHSAARHHSDQGCAARWQAYRLHIG
jgi:hypothetical protein